MPALQPTVTTRIRSFLTDHGATVEPWSGQDEVFGALYGLLNQRKDDPGFWPPLQGLLDELVRWTLDPQRSHRLPAPEAELLASWDIEALVDELRAALPGGEVTPDPTAVPRFASRLSSAVMGGFLLLGVAASAGCADDDTDLMQADAAVSDTAAPDQYRYLYPDYGPWDKGCTLDPTSVLYTSLASAKDLSHFTRRTLCNCLAGLSKSWNLGLTQLFATGKPDEIAAVLVHMVTCCNGHNDKELDLGFDQAKAELLKKKLCQNRVPIYKGVSFPE